MARQFRRGIVALPAVLLLCLPLTAGAYDFTIEGRFLCRTSAADPSPIVGARVEFWHNYIGGTIDFDTTQMSPPTYTDANGYYKSPNIHGDDDTNYYAKIVLNDDAAGPGSGARLHQFYTQGSEYYLSPLAEDSKGNANFTRILNDDLGTSAPECAIWQNTHTVYQSYCTTVGNKPCDKVSGPQPPAADYDIVIEIASGTAWTTLSTTHWPYNYQPNLRRSFHEFGHSIRHTLDGSSAEFYSDASKYVYARNHNPCDETNHGFAFNEGWAEYWAQSWDPAPNCNSETYNHQNTEREGVVAMALANLAMCPAPNDVGLLPAVVGGRGMVGVLKDNPGSIHSLQEFYAAFQTKYPALHPDMFSGCPGVTTAGLTSVGDGGDGTSVRPAIASVLKKIDHRMSSLSASIKKAQADSRLALVCRVPACLPQAYDQVVRLYALESELERSRLLMDLIKRTSSAQGSKTVMFSPAADGAAETARHFDRRNAQIVESFAARALQATKPLVERDQTGSLARKALELSQGLARMQNPVRDDKVQYESPHFSLADSLGYPEALKVH